MYRFLLAAVAVAIIGLLGAARPASAQYYESVGTIVLPVSLTYGQSVTVSTSGGTSYSATCWAALCPAGETVSVNGTALTAYGSTYGSYISVAPVYASASYSVAPVYSAAYAAPLYEPSYLPSYSVAPVYSGGCSFFCGGFGSFSGFRSGRSGVPFHRGDHDHDRDDHPHVPSGGDHHRGR